MADSLTTAPKITRAPARPAEIKETPLKIRVENLNFYYGETPRPARHLDCPACQPGVGLHRALGLRQEHLPAHPQPHERHHPRHARRGEDSASTTRTSTGAAPTWSICDAAWAWCSRSRIRFRSRSSRTSPTASASTAWPATGPTSTAARRGKPQERRALGRGEGPAARVGAGAYRAGSSSGCASRARSRFGRRFC